MVKQAHILIHFIQYRIVLVKIPMNMSSNCLCVIASKNLYEGEIDVLNWTNNLLEKLILGLNEICKRISIRELICFD